MRNYRERSYQRSLPTILYAGGRLMLTVGHPIAKRHLQQGPLRQSAGALDVHPEGEHGFLFGIKSKGCARFCSKAPPWPAKGLASDRVFGEYRRID